MSSLQPNGSSHVKNVTRDAEDDSDGEKDWEEIVAPASSTAAGASAPEVNRDEPVQSGNLDTLTVKENLEITIQKANKVDPKRKKQAEQSAEYRALRLTCHKIHTVALLSNALTRNKWINDPLLHGRLLSLTPLSLQTAFATITKKLHPNSAMRGRLFETSLMRLTEWWYDTFIVEDSGHMRSRTFDQVQRILFNVDFDYDDEGEVVKSSKSLMKHTLNRRGSRDVSAQLFTALCRALDIPARLVISIQSVPWQASVGKPKMSGRSFFKKGEREPSLPSSDMESDGHIEGDDDMEEVSIPSTTDIKGKTKLQFPGEGQSLSGASTPSRKGKEKALPKPVVKLRKSKAYGRKLGSTPGSGHSTMWTEVFSRPDGRWMPVDPIRYIVNKRKVFEPPSHDKNNRMVYVVAVEEDGYCRDVTPRYAKDYGTKTTKAQLGGKGRKDWWEGVMALVTRPYRLLRDDVEDEEFEYNKYSEGMPTSIAGFKDHSLYVLEKHLKREEVIFPKIEMGKFRGVSVYPRSNVVPLKTAENWMRIGRRVKEGAQAMKLVKQRAVTIHRRRAMEQAQQDGDEMLQGLYSEAQTELYVPEPVVDGIIPKNDFGNIDLYTPSMLPRGAVHIPYKRAAKIARNLGFDYAEAVTSFEFKKGRAFPVISGIVIAAENEETLLNAYWEAERDEDEKERKKQKERVIKRWTKLIQGLRIRQRLQEEYASSGKPTASALPLNDKEETEQPGGFLVDAADTIVQPFHLPRFEHGAYQPSLNNMEKAVGQVSIADEYIKNKSADASPSASKGFGMEIEAEANAEAEEMIHNDPEEIEILPPIDKQHGTPTGKRFPKTMRELAEELSARHAQGEPSEAIDDADQNSDTVISAVGYTTPLPEHAMNRVSGSSEKRSSKSTTAKMALRKKATSSKTSKRARPTRKRAPPLDSDDDSPDVEGGSTEEEARHGGETSSNQQFEEPKPNLKRKRSETVPAISSTRVLRARVPRSTEKLKAEKEAEEAYRQAIAE
ncbi:hypothetical protein EW145_g849 [Phellinidium pouzarii]|uniref:Rad4 beta-hairpin domain-containing protein n=1 Tax=Phellinidium pouzarii TaxID=167371 RepID=A0A4V3XDV5_9AGAM|nr:hypothetical protein EW145_g849 [Phellinidium pouzarii]